VRPQRADGAVQALKAPRSATRRLQICVFLNATLLHARSLASMAHAARVVQTFPSTLTMGDHRSAIGKGDVLSPFRDHAVLSASHPGALERSGHAIVHLGIESLRNRSTARRFIALPDPSDDFHLPRPPASVQKEKAVTSKLSLHPATS